MHLDRITGKNVEVLGVAEHLRLGPSTPFYTFSIASYLYLYLERKLRRTRRVHKDKILSPRIK